MKRTRYLPKDASSERFLEDKSIFFRERQGNREITRMPIKLDWLVTRPGRQVAGD